MRLLLDTHIFLWWVKGDQKINKYIEYIQNAQNVYVSSASIWEISIKIKLNKLNADVDQLVKAISDSDFTELPITFLHAKAVANLPDIHRDPFDRILIAQAITEPLKFITADALLEEYSNIVEVIK